MKLIEVSALWCSSCLVMKKVIQEVLKEIEIEYICYDIDFDEEAKQYEENDKLPILVLEKDGIVCSKLIGEKKKDEVVAWIRENMHS